MKQPHRERARVVHCLLFGLVLLLGVPVSFSQAQAVMPITPSGLHTTVSAPISLPSGQTQFDITGGTRPGGGANLFHSFGDFNVPNHNIANFLNDSGLATSNILGRVTGGNISNIFGTIQTTGFGNANLFLMNPAGFLFGPTATVNVGGMMTFTSANYLKLADGVRFNATPSASADLLLSAAPVAAFGFLGSNPGAITVQGSQLTVADGTGITLVGGNITVQAGTLTAPSGQINLVSVGKPSHPNVGGEVVVAGSGQGAGFIPTSFKSMGAISLAQGSTIDTSTNPGSGNPAGRVLIRGGQLTMDNSTIQAETTTNAGVQSVGGNIEVTAQHVELSNSSVSTHTTGGAVGSAAGNITFNADIFSSKDSGLNANVVGYAGNGGSVTIQGLQGPGTSAHAVSLTNTGIDTHSFFLGNGGPIAISASDISLNHAGLSGSADEGHGAMISLTSNRHLTISDSTFFLTAFDGSGGTVDLQAGRGVHLTNTIIDAHASMGLNGGTITMAAPSISISDSRLDVQTGGTLPGGTIRLTGTKAVSLTNDTLVGVSEGIGGTITMVAPSISIRGSRLDVQGFEGGPGGTISLTGTKAVSLTNGTVLDADNFGPSGTGGTILINGGGRFTSQQSTISAQSTLGHGGIIHVEANKVRLTDSQLTTAVSGGPQTVGGTISVDAKNLTLRNSQILSTATEGQGGTILLNGGARFTSQQGTISAQSTLGHGGTIGITSNVLHRDAGSIIDTSSQSGTNGTVTINGVIQP